MGVVYYANYFVYFEMARSEMLREAGIPYATLEQAGVTLPVVEASCTYLKSAHYDDVLLIRSVPRGFTGAKLRIDYDVWRDVERIARGYTLHVCLSRSGKVLRPIPELLRLVGCQEGTTG